MFLKGRLNLVASKVPTCNIVCDIGTDHAYLPIYLIDAQRCEKALACDVKKSPLMSAKNNIDKFNMLDLIDVRLGSGIEPVDISEIDVIVIAGMGGILIKKILEKELDKSQKANCIVLQPMQDIDIVREWLYENGFEILDEELIMEGRKLYNVIQTKWTGICKRVDKVYYYIGEKLIEKKDPLLNVIINREMKRLEKIIKEIEKNSIANSDIKNEYENLYNNLKNIYNLNSTL